MYPHIHTQERLKEMHRVEHEKLDSEIEIVKALLGKLHPQKESPEKEEVSPEL